jgi:uncharacterized membrane protein (DUF106 family)
MVKELLISNPKLTIIIISVLVTLIMTLITKHTTNQSRMKELKKIQKACQIKLKDAKGDMKKQQEIQKELMACSMELMKHSFKPMLITFIPLLILIWWIRGIYSDVLSGWIWYYILASVASSLIFRKVFNVV